MFSAIRAATPRSGEASSGTSAAAADSAGDGVGCRRRRRGLDTSGPLGRLATDPGRVVLEELQPGFPHRLGVLEVSPVHLVHEPLVRPERLFIYVAVIQPGHRFPTVVDVPPRVATPS